MVILQSHRTQNMISQCICYTLETYQILSPVLFLYIFPPFNSQNFLFTCLCSFFTCFAVLEESTQYQAGALLRPKNGYLVWSRGDQGGSDKVAHLRNNFEISHD